MKRLIIAIVVIIIIAALFLCLVPWLENGGWPSSGPVGGSLPPNIQHVLPRDGDVLEETNGFCVHFDYQVGIGMDEESQETTRYFFDGRNVTKQVYDIVSLEYPTQIGEPCYIQIEPINPGWHNAKVTYKDNSGNYYEYKWRFQVIDEK